MKNALDDQLNGEGREGALFLYQALCEHVGKPAEPHLLRLFFQVLERLGDKAIPVKFAAEVAANVLLKTICPHAIKILLPGGYPLFLAFFSIFNGPPLAEYSFYFFNFLFYQKKS